MAIFGSLNGVLGLETKSWTDGAKKAGDDIDRLKKKTEGFMAGMEGFRKTGLGQALEIGVGGGAMRVFDEAGRRIGEMVDNVGKVVEEWNKGTASAGDMVDAVAKGIPVVGSFWEAGRKIHDLFDSEAADVAAINAEVKEQADEWAKRLANIQAGTKAIEELREALNKIKRTDALKMMPDGIEKMMAQNNDALAAFKKPIQDKIKALGIDALQGKLRKASEDLSVHEKAGVKTSGSGGLIGMMVGNAGIDPADEKAFKDKNDKLTTARDNARKELADAQRTAEGLTKTITDAQAHFQGQAARAMGEAIIQPFKTGFNTVIELADKWKTKMLSILDETAAKNRQHLADISKQLTEESLTPMQKFLEEMKQIDALQSVGGITSATHDALQKKYLGQFESANGAHLDEFRPVEAVENPFGLGKVHNNLAASGPLDKLAATAMTALEEQRKGLKLAPETIAALKNGTIEINF